MLKTTYLLLFASIILRAQDPEVIPRQIWSEDFLKKRPGQPSHPRQNEYLAIPNSQLPTGAPVAPAKPSLATGRAASALPKTENPPVNLTLGMTLWRLVSAKSTGARLLILGPSGAKSEEVTPERVRSNTLLSEGDRIRITVEVPTTGFLYVVDREQYANGAYSDPYLIYPDRLTRSGDNAVAPGRVIEIPDRRDEPNYFTVTSGGSEKIAEVLSLLISPDQIPDLKADPTALRIDLNRFGDWERKWSVAQEGFELKDSPGALWTEKEKAAGATKDTILTQDDAMPQTLYRISHAPGSPILLKVALHFK